jgi:quercetin dioxygenase-like cupin family protein
MHILDPDQVNSEPGNPAYFSGGVTLRRLAAGEDLGANKLFRVEFPAGARTNWHTHSGVQLLIVLEGRCRFQHANGPISEAGAGELILIPPGEKHWHGATPDAPMVHLAINMAAETNWLEKVTDEQYLGG